MEHRRVLSIQSHVVSGYVGNKCAVFALQQLGIDVDPINTVQFSNHTGYPTFEGEVLKPTLIQTLYKGLTMNHLNNYSHLLTGYMNNTETLRAIMSIVDDLRKKNPKFIYVCDPVMGDDGKLYQSVPPSMVTIYQEEVLSKVDFLLPNQTECELLTETLIKSEEDALKAINILHTKYGVRNVVITSTKFDAIPNKLFVYGSQNQGVSFVIEIDSLPGQFTGTGDLFSALLLGWTSSGLSLVDACEKTVETLQQILTETLQHKHYQSPLLSTCELNLIKCGPIIQNPKSCCYCVKITRLG